MTEVKVSLMSQVIGHQRQKTTLSRALAKNRVFPVQLFVGPSGIGKKQLATAFVQTIFCSHRNHEEACGQCQDCSKLEQGHHENLKTIYPEKATIKAESARQILEFLNLQCEGPRAILIDEAQCLNSSSGNILLKILEEAPKRVYFFLVSSNRMNILLTIRSRSQFLQFTPLSEDELLQIHNFDPWALSNSLGSAEKAFELQQDDGKNIQKKLFVEFRNFIKSRKRETTVAALRELLVDKKTSFSVVFGLQSLLHKALLIRSGKKGFEGESDYNQFLNQLAQNSQYDLSSWGNSVIQLEKDFITNADKILSFENFLNSLN